MKHPLYSVETLNGITAYDLTKDQAVKMAMAGGVCKILNDSQEDVTERFIHRLHGKIMITLADGNILVTRCGDAVPGFITAELTIQEAVE